MRRRFVPGCLLAVLMTGCGIQQTGTGGEGTLTEDSSVNADSNAATVDSGSTPPIDSASPPLDEGTLDTSVSPDTFVADSSVSDTFVPDTFVPDTFVPDTFVPDTFVPDTFVPDTFVPDTFVPDTFVPDTFVPDTFVVDTFVPDTYVVACTESGGKIYAGHCYFILPGGSVNYDAARTGCIGRGAHLVTITSAAEQTAVQTLGSGDRWIGLRATSMVDRKASYAWINGDPVTYDHWASGEPNDTGGCARMQGSGSGHTWGNWYCNETWPALCERE